jgi:hypothetical protein
MDFHDGDGAPAPAENGRDRRSFLKEAFGTVSAVSAVSLAGPFHRPPKKRRRRNKSGVKAADSAGRYLAAYNGNSNESGSTLLGLNGYGIGFAVSDDGARSFNRVAGGKLFKPTGGSNWDANFVKDPSIAVVGRRLFMAYMGTPDGNTLKIGLAVWKNGIPTGTPNVRTLLIDPAAGASWESGSVHFPHLYYDEDNDVLHLWYSGQPRSGSTTSSIGHATIDTGTLDLTKDPASPIAVPSAADSEGGLVMGCVFRDDDGTWNLFAGAFNADSSRANSVRYTAPAPEGPWTRDGYVYTVRPNAIQLLTANASSSANTVSVADSSVFVKGDPVYVQDSKSGTNSAVIGADNWEVNYIAAIPSSNQIRLREPLSNSYATSRAAEIVALDQIKVMPRSCVKEKTKYVLPSTAWFAGNQTYHEDSIALVTSNLASKPYTLDRARGLLLDRTGSTGATRNAWDKVSAENMSAIEYGGIDKVMNAGLRSPASRQTKTRKDGLGLTSSSWAALDTPGGWGSGLDGYIAAEAGDLIRITPQLEAGDDARWLYLDIVTVVFPGDVGQIRSWVSGGSGSSTDQGITAWRCQPNTYVQLGAPITFQVGETDLQCGMIDLRVMYRLSAGSNKRYLHLDRSMSYENLGGGFS